jgi:RND family efflux transporter MFP subunit
MRASAIRTILLSMVLLGACHPARSVERPPIAVEVVTVTQSRAEPSYSVSGEVRARNESALSFQVSGKVVERRVDIGDHVAAGDVLARLDAKQQQADLDVSTATQRSAEVATRQARIQFERESALLKGNATSQASYDAAEERLRTAESELASARAALGLTREALSYTELRAPRAGTVIAREVEVGLLARATEPAFVLAEDGPRDAVFRVPEAFARQIEGKKVTLKLVDDETRGPYEGVVREVAPSVEADTASVAIKVTIQGVAQQAEPHTGVSETAPTHSQPDVVAQAFALRAPIIGQFALTPTRTVLLPAPAITSDAGYPAVWVVDPETHRVSLRRIDVQAYTSDTIYVNAGLSTGDIVVTRGANRVFPNQVVSFNGADKA